jgi:hypothetical protein
LLKYHSLSFLEFSQLFIVACPSYLVISPAAVTSLFVMSLNKLGEEKIVHIQHVSTLLVRYFLWHWIGSVPFCVAFCLSLSKWHNLNI